jgi:DNA-binding MarR family transcriptional regulator
VAADPANGTTSDAPDDAAPGDEVGADSLVAWRGVRALVLEGLDDSRRRVVELTGLPFSRIRALRRLRRSGPITHSALAEAMMVDRPAASVAVADLCARGLVVRRPHPSDRRSKLVSLTPAGREVIDRVESFVPPPPDGWAGIPADDVAALLRVLRGVGHDRVARAIAPDGDTG